MINVSAKPRGSVLILTDFAGASFDDEAIRTIKETAVFETNHSSRNPH